MIAKNYSLPDEVVIQIRDIFQNDPDRDDYDGDIEAYAEDVMSGILSKHFDTPIIGWQDMEIREDGTVLVRNLEALPAEVTIENASSVRGTIDDVFDDIADIVSDQYDYCIFSYSYRYESRTDTITVYDIDWDIDENTENV